MSGKISLQDLPREDIYFNINYENQMLPEFMEDMEEYQRCLDVIAETNFIEDADPEDCIKIPEAKKIPTLEDKLKDTKEDEASNKSEEKNDSFFASECSPSGMMTGTNRLNLNKDTEDFSKTVKLLEGDKKGEFELKQLVEERELK